MTENRAGEQSISVLFSQAIVAIGERKKSTDNENKRGLGVFHTLNKMSYSTLPPFGFWRKLHAESMQSDFFTQGSSTIPVKSESELGLNFYFGQNLVHVTKMNAVKQTSAFKLPRNFCISFKPGSVLGSA